MVRSSDMTDKTDVQDTDLDIGMVDVDDSDTAEVAVYEVGYHFLPTLSEEGLAAEVEKMTAVLKGANADFVGERFPAKMGLAYPISKKVNDTNTQFDSSYFGWIAFEIPKKALSEVRAAFHNNPSILRYLIVTTDREAVAAAMTGAVVTPTGDIGKPKREEEIGGEVSETALAEALHNIEEEDAKTTD